MEAQEQRSGEKRVQALLVDSLMARGLLRPAGLSADQFAEMQRDICARLAYMSPAALLALEEQCAAHPGGPQQNRFPISVHILKWAAQIEPPPDDASPLIRAVFAHAIGEAALRDGYAPELLAHIRKHRAWPSAYMISTIRSGADQPMRALAQIEARLARGEQVSAPEAQFRDQRCAVLDKCRAIRASALRADGA